MGKAEFLLVEQVANDAIDQRGDRKNRIGFKIRVQRNQSFVSIVCARQTAETLA